jgi:hypothetical protein
MWKVIEAPYLQQEWSLRHNTWKQLVMCKKAEKMYVGLFHHVISTNTRVQNNPERPDLWGGQEFTIVSGFPHDDSLC